MHIAPVLAGATGSAKPHTRPAAPAPSARRATEEAARTTSATKVRGGGAWGTLLSGGKGWSKRTPGKFNEKQPQLYAPFN